MLFTLRARIIGFYISKRKQMTECPRNYAFTVFKISVATLKASKSRGYISAKAWFFGNN
jgi:hypothetical protein